MPPDYGATLDEAQAEGHTLPPTLLIHMPKDTGAKGRQAETLPAKKELCFASNKQGWGVPARLHACCG